MASTQNWIPQIPGGWITKSVLNGPVSVLIHQEEEKGMTNQVLFLTVGHSESKR